MFWEISGNPKILFVGNSITKHAPKADINWLNDCGMAASQTDKDYAYKNTARQSTHLLSNTSLNVSEISNMTGFSDPLYFSRLFAKKFSVPPTVYRKNN